VTLLIGATATAASQPNIVILLADDMGYGDLVCYGGKAVPTPNLDRLAVGGVRFTDGYVTCPACAPSRLGLMSGAYQQRFGMFWNSDRTHTLPPQQKLLPELLRGAGYTTGLIGKWNIARKKETVFDEIHDYVEWESDYFPDAEGRYIGSGIESGTGVRSSKTNVWGPEKPGDEYLTDRMGRHAVEFIQRHAAQPFCLYVAFNAVHSPWNARRADLAKVAHHPHEVLRLYYAMVAALDENVGRVLDALDAARLTDNTLVVFLSDNGPANGGKWIEGWDPAWPKQLIVGSAGPLRGQKVEVLEGGIRVPFLLRWPAKLPAGTTFTQPVIACDVLPTACAAAGIPIPATSLTDGVNLLPHLAGEKPAPPHATLFWKTKADAALRRGDWKLVLQGPNPAPQLYHLATDIGEVKNLATEKPDLTRELHAEWQAWNVTLPPASQPSEPKAKQP
jgi:arylsulfatase A-like enzyme